MKSLRHLCVLAHRYVGLFIMPWLFVVALSGSVIAFYGELRHTLNPELFYVVPLGEKMSVDALSQLIYARHPNVKISYFSVDQDIEEGRGSYEVYVRPLATLDEDQRSKIDFDVLHINPYSGEELGRYESEAIAFDRRVIMRMFYDLHEQLLGNALGPDVGRWCGVFLGIISLLWIFDTFIAAYISLPRKGPLLKMLSVKWNGSTYRLNFDFHRASGTLLIAIFLMMAVSGAYWLADFGGIKPVEAAFQAALPSASDPAVERPVLEPEMDRPLVTFGEAIRIARQELDRQNTAYGELWDFWTDDQKGVIYIEHYLPAGTFGPRGPVVTIDGRTGAVLATYRTPQSTMSAGNNVDTWMYALHSGRILGFWGRVIISMTGLVCCGLCITGFVIWRKKAAAARFSRARSMERQCPSPLAGPN
jgi:uncharacterized iron-regulated membrane protein